MDLLGTPYTLKRNCQLFYNEIYLTLRILRDRQCLNVLLISHVLIFSVQRLKGAYYKSFVKRMCIVGMYMPGVHLVKPVLQTWKWSSFLEYRWTLLERAYWKWTNEYHHAMVKVFLCMCQGRRTITDICQTLRLFASSVNE